MELEAELANRFKVVGGMDEVGRGCLAGPVCVGLVVGSPLPPPTGLTDSKKLSAKRRESLYQPILEWAREACVGWASAVEVDRFGIIGALRLAGLRAVRDVTTSLANKGNDPMDAILLDGSHNWLASTDTLWGEPQATGPLPPVFTLVKADLTCPSVSAASVLAKVERDRHMEVLPDPGYDWASNKGYGSVRHRDAIRMLGPSDEHRKTWKLLG